MRTSSIFASNSSSVGKFSVTTNFSRQHWALHPRCSRFLVPGLPLEAVISPLHLSVLCSGWGTIIRQYNQTCGDISLTEGFFLGFLLSLTLLPRPDLVIPRRFSSDEFRRASTSFDEFRRVSTSFDEFRRVSTRSGLGGDLLHPDFFRQNPTGRKSRKLSERSENVGKCRKMSEIVGKCRKLSENVGNCWKMSVIVGKCRNF